MKRLIFIVFCLILTLEQGHALKLYLLSNHDNAGDHNQALGISKVFEKFLSSPSALLDIDVNKESAENIKEKVEKELMQEKVVIIGTGEGGIQGIKDLTPNPNLIIGLTSHTFLSGYDDSDLLKKVSFIALPVHISTEIKKKLGTKLLEITGVAHNRNAESADETYKTWKSELPSNPLYIGVVLGGDAPMPSNEIKLFTKKDAEQLANYISSTIKDGCILVLNGPRTGKHDDNKQEIKTAHKDGNLDRVTQDFKTILESKIEPTRVKVLDFQFNHKPPYNSFDLVAGAVKATNGKMFIPGESTSMISEAVDILSPGQVIVYNDSAMNEVHKAHVQSEFQANRISLLDNYKNVESLNTSYEGPKASAAETIAKRLLEAVNR